MMLSSVIGVCAMAPRQSGLKKPRPLRSLSVQEEIAIKQVDDKAAVRKTSLGSRASLGSPQFNVSTDHASGQLGSPVCKEIAALSSSFFAFADNQKESTDMFKSLNRQDSNSSYSSCNSYYQAFERQDSCSSVGSVDFSASNNLSKCTSSTGESLMSVETSYLDSPAPNLNINSNIKSFHNNTTVVSGCPQPLKFDCKNELNGSFSTDHSESGRCRYHHNSTLLSSKQEKTYNKALDCNQSYQSQSRGTTKVTLVTGSGEELAVTGNNFKTILQACRTILKELDAKLVKIETVLNDDESCQIKPDNRSQSTTVSDRKMKCASSETSVDGRDCPHARPLHTQKELKKCWYYTKRQLLNLSMSVLSHQPPLLWNVIAKTHSECCLSANKILLSITCSDWVREYFDPSLFCYHDGTLVLARFRWEQN